ncbi:MAG: hypothetical protein GX424_00535 [Clostridiales bacterium]|nr:hypothetical protein [Clostridiales bacterium]
MLTKMIKWDLRATYRKFTAVLVAFILLCMALPGVLFAVNPGAAQVYSMLTFSLGPTALYIVMIAFILQYYNTNLYGDEGYMTFTLPATGWRLLLSKMILALFWMLAAAVLIGLSVFTSIKIIESNSRLSSLFAPVWNFYRMDAAHWITFGALFLLGNIDCVLAAFFSITVSKLSVWRKGGIAMGFVTFVFIYIAQSLPALLWNGELRYVTETVSQSEAVQTMNMSVVCTVQHNLISLAVYAAVSIIVFWAAARLLDKTTSLK